MTVARQGHVWGDALNAMVEGTEREREERTKGRRKKAARGSAQGKKPTHPNENESARGRWLQVQARGFTTPALAHVICKTALFTPYNNLKKSSAQHLSLANTHLAHLR